MKHFPSNFLLGASSSAFQIEGAYSEDGKGLSIADINSFKKSDVQADTKVASDFYHHYKEDIALMKELGMQLYRFSFAWSRIIPDGEGEINPKGLAFYDKVVDELLANGIQPFVTLYHFDLPYALVEKYNGWQSRACIDAFERYATICFEHFKGRVFHWQIHNEQNLMVRVNNRMNIEVSGQAAEELRYQMDYHMCVAHAKASIQCHKIDTLNKVGPAVSATVTYPISNRPEDVYSAKMNDLLKTEYMLDMHKHGEYPGYFLRYLKNKHIELNMPETDKEFLKHPLAAMDYIAVNYYRTLTTSYLSADEKHSIGTRLEGMNEVDFNLYGYFKIHKNENLDASEYGAQIDPLGLRLVLNSYYAKYGVPLMIAENGLGTADVLEAGEVHDPYRISYLYDHLQACLDAIDDGVEMIGYSLWSFMDLLSSHQGFKKRYGLVYVNRDDFDLKDMQRIKKDSYYWYQNVIKCRKL